MPKLEPASPIAGAEVLVALLLNPNEFRERMEALAKLREEANAAVTRANMTGDIGAAHAAASVDRAKAADMLKLAKAQAEAILAAATQERDKALAEVVRARTELHEVQTRLAGERDTAAREGTLRQQALAEATQRSEAAWTEAHAARDAALALKQEWADKVGRLKAAIVA